MLSKMKSLLVQKRKKKVNFKANLYYDQNFNGAKKLGPFLLP